MAKNNVKKLAKAYVKNFKNGSIVYTNTIEGNLLDISLALIAEIKENKKLREGNEKLNKMLDVYREHLYPQLKEVSRG